LHIVGSIRQILLAVICWSQWACHQCVQCTASSCYRLGEF